MRNLLAVLLLTCSSVARAADKPNVLLISVDDLNDLPTFCGRYPDAKTPHLDRLALRGLVFTNAHCQFLLCGPSRASVMTGMHPSTLGYDHHMKDEAVQKRARELGTELLHTTFGMQGYTTLAVGKIFHNHVPRGTVDASGKRGGFAEGTGKLKRNWHQNGTSTDWAMAPELDSQLPDHSAAAWAVRQLRAEHEKPFFLMVGFLRPHVPWYVPKKWFDLYDKDKLTLPPYEKDDLNDVPDIAKRISILDQMPRTDWAIENDQWRNILHAYLASISFADHQVGKVLDALEASPYADNTLIVLWSDHGYHMEEKNYLPETLPLERSSHVPLVFAGPEVEAGMRCDRIVNLLDMYPTLLEMCGLPANPKNQGESLVPLIQDPNKAWRHPAITGWKENSFAVQSEQYRYIRYGDGSEELYDHQTDLDEIVNLAGKPGSEKIRQEMAKALSDALGENEG